MNVVEVTWKRATKVWWSFTWRAVLAGFVAGLVIGIAATVISVFVDPYGGTDAAMAVLDGPLATLALWVILIPIAVWAMRSTLTNGYSDFYITLAPYDVDKRDTKSESAATEAERTQEPRRAAA